MYTLKRNRIYSITFETLLLDTIPSNIAYSVRKLSSSYSGSCMRVRRDSDDTETDIGFVDGWLDEAAIASFCGASNGYVSIMYDQSGNGRDASEQSDNDAREPQIYDGVSVFQSNGKPTLKRVINNTNLWWSDLTDYTTVTIFSVARFSANGQCIYDGISAATRHSWEVSGSDEVMYAGASLNGGAYVNTQALRSGLYDGASSILRRNGIELASGTVGTQDMRGQVIVNNTNLSNACAEFQELIRFNSDQSANFSTIEDDINTAYTIY
jgi:hypothetical protein